MILQPVPRPNVTFVAIAERTTDRWFAVFVGALGGIPTGLIAGLIYVATR